MDPASLPCWDLPEGVTSRFVNTFPAGLKFHVLEAVPSHSLLDEPDLEGRCPPLILLLHGFPNLSYDWRFIMPRLAAGGYYAVAFDLRGFGRTHNVDLGPISQETIRPSTAIHDMVTLINALGYTAVHTLVGQDLGAYLASVAALALPNMIKSLVLMAHTWKGFPAVPFATSPSPLLAPTIKQSTRVEESKDADIHASLARLKPPRKHYKWYNASASASGEWTYPLGEPMRDFLKGYFFLKSGANTRQTPPRPLRSWTAEELAVMPHYYIMRADETVRQNVAMDMADESQHHVADSLKPWLSDADLAAYEQEYARTTFKCPLAWYAALTDPKLSADLSYLAGSKICVPTKYVSGLNDWGTYQVPGGLEAMQQGVSVRQDCWRGATLVPGAGHWINMEKPGESAAEILELAKSIPR